MLARLPTVLALMPIGSAVAGSTGFIDEAAARGVVYTVSHSSTFGAGVAFADLDGDHDPDLLVIGSDRGFGVYENLGGGVFAERFVDITIGAAPFGSGICAADYDGDGDLDVYVTVWFAPNVLLRNDGAFRFSHVGAAAGVDDDGAGTGCAWGDYDGDNLLDLYVSNRTGSTDPGGTDSTAPNRLYRNRADGTFEDTAGILGVDAGASPTFQACFFDFDRDADADLYLAADHGISSNCGWHNQLWRNDGGQFTEVSAASGADVCIDAMCIAPGDINGDLLPDIYVTNTPTGNALLINQGNGTFVEDAAAAGVAVYSLSWGALFFDHDNDADQDLFVCNMISSDSLFENTGVWPLPNAAGTLGVADPGPSFSVAAADIDDDGDLDLAVSIENQLLRLYVNQLDGARSWIKFRIVGEGANTFGVGTVVDVSSGSVVQTREMIAGSAYKSQDDLTLHFGLDAAGSADSIVVRWPNATTRTLTGYAANRTWTLYPPQRLGDADGDGVVGMDDLDALLGCIAGTFEPGCEIMDFDGDGDVDLTDLTAFLMRLNAGGGGSLVTTSESSLP